LFKLCSPLVPQFSAFPYHLSSVVLEGGGWTDLSREESCPKGRWGWWCKGWIRGCTKRNQCWR